MICIAVVKIWKVVTHLDQVVDYAEDHNKTDLSNFKDLNDLMDYAMNGDKTEESLYISGINCDPNNATKEMIMIKDKYRATCWLFYLASIGKFLPQGTFLVLWGNPQSPD